MELYHLHTKGIKNNVWREKKKIRIDDNCCEYLMKGKVKILEKVDEFIKN